MYELIIDKLRDKKIAILGFGREGKSTYNFIKKYIDNYDVTIVDKDNIDVSDSSIKVVVGDDYLDNLDIYELIIKSPGISLKDIDISNIRNKITSQLELLLEVFRDNVIGITGTKGKSTTSSLLYETIKYQYSNTFLIGNIGKPVFDDIELYNKESILVIEMSSHQLEYVNVSPHIGVILNLYEDHLDHDGTIENYHNNKMNIFKYQNEKDYAIYADDNNYLYERMNNDIYKGIRYTVRFDNTSSNGNNTRINDKDIYINGLKVYHDDDTRKILGNHNLMNIMFVLTVCNILGLDLEKVGVSINSFNGLKFRMEFIGKYHDIKFYNDTIATIPEATINAIDTIGDVDTLIFGGMDRGIDYADFIDYLNKSNINNFICMPTTGNIIGKMINKNKNVFYVDNLDDAYKVSLNNTKKNMSCLLSPAAASYEFYKNFEEKGRIFEGIVNNN